MADGKNLRDETAAQQIKDTIETMEEKNEQLSALVTKAEKAHSPEKSSIVSPTVNPKPATTPSTNDEWTSLALSMPEEWHTCQSSVTSGDDEKSTDEYFSCIDSAEGSRRPSGATSALQRTLATVGNVRKTPIPMVSASQLAKWKETSSTTSTVKETKISSSTKADGKTVMSISEEKLTEEWRRTPDSSTHSKDVSSTFERIEDKPPSKPPRTTSSPTPAPVLDETPVQDKKPEVTSAPVDAQTNGTVVSSDMDQVSLKLEALLTEDDLKNNPLLKHINESKEWLQLKILEMEPDLAKIGTNLEEAQEYQQQHEDVLRKLQ